MQSKQTKRIKARRAERRSIFQTGARGGAERRSIDVKRCPPLGRAQKKTMESVINLFFKP